MKTWRLSDGAEACGTCTELVPVDTPIQIIQLDKVARPLKRCPLCAGETPPDVLPPRRVPGAVTAPGFVALGAVARGTLPLDFKARQCREPGEDDA